MKTQFNKMIKPTKNRFFCPACGKNKMLFPTEKAANNFLKYNQAELIELYGKAPVRTYYCDVCMGWHLTSTKGKFVISAYQLLDIKLHQTAAEELSIYQSRMAEIIRMYEAHQFAEVLSPISELLIELFDKTFYGISTKNKVGSFYNILTDCYRKEFRDLEHIVHGPNYEDAYPRMARLLPLLQIISSTKDERLTTIYNENSKRLKILFKTYECRVQEELGKQIQHLTR